jgi:hypothetical protein
VAITIGIILGGPEQFGKTVDLALTWLGQLLAREQRNQPPDKTTDVSILFRVAGSIWTPEHTDIIASSQANVVGVEVPICRFADDPGALRLMVLSLTREAIMAAAAEAQRLHLPMATERYLALVDRIQAGEGEKGEGKRWNGDAASL